MNMQYILLCQLLPAKTPRIFPANFLLSKLQVSSIINICKTIFVAVILTMGNLFFSKDVNNLALNDINRMLKKVKEIATNPLSCKDEKMMKLMEMVEKRSLGGEEGEGE